MDLFKIVVDNELKNFKVFKKIKIDEKNIKQKIIYIQDQDYDIFTNGPIEIQDSVLNGSSLFQPLLIKSINELPYFINQRLQLQLNNDSKLIGKLISIEYISSNNIASYSSITLELEDLNSLKVPKVFKDKNNISVLTLDIQSFIPLENDQNFNKINHNNNNNNNNNNSIKIILNEDKTFRDIIISYDIPFLSSQVSTTLPVKVYNSFSNIIQGDINIDSIYNDKELKSKIPITFKTVFSWFPKWTIISNEGIELIIISNDGKQRYVINNFKCIKDHFTQTTVNVFQSSITRALLFEPLLGTFKYSIYFKNNSNIIINKSNNVKIINNNQNQNQNNNINNEYFLLNNISPNKRGIILFDSINKNSSLFKDISFINNNNKYSSSSPSPSNSNSSILSSNIQYNQLKLSKDYTLLFTNNKIKSSYSIFNISDINTKYIVYYSESFQIPLSSNHSSKLLSNGKEISTNCFIFKGDSFSISKIKITNLIESIYISNKLSNETIELLKENNIDINLNNKNELYNISYLSEEVKDRVIKSLILENTTLFNSLNFIDNLFLKQVYLDHKSDSGNKSSDLNNILSKNNNIQQNKETLEKQVKDPINLFETPYIEELLDEDGIEYLIPKTPIKKRSGNNKIINNSDNSINTRTLINSNDSPRCRSETSTADSNDSNLNPSVTETTTGFFSSNSSLFSSFFGNNKSSLFSNKSISSHSLGKNNTIDSSESKNHNQVNSSTIKNQKAYKSFKTTQRSTLKLKYGKIEYSTWVCNLCGLKNELYNNSCQLCFTKIDSNKTKDQSNPFLFRKQNPQFSSSNCKSSSSSGFDSKN